MGLDLLMSDTCHQLKAREDNMERESRTRKDVWRVWQKPPVHDRPSHLRVSWALEDEQWRQRE